MSIIFGIGGFALGYITAKIAHAIGMKPFSWQSFVFFVAVILLAQIIIHVLGGALR